MRGLSDFAAATAVRLGVVFDFLETPHPSAFGRHLLPQGEKEIQVTSLSNANSRARAELARRLGRALVSKASSTRGWM